MSLKTTEEQLVRLLAEEDNKVVALSGKWGTGKSFMWEKVKDGSKDGKVQNALYASLFGLSTIEQVKLKLIQSALPSVEENPAIWEGAKNLFNAGVKALEGFHKSFGALNDVGLLFAPAMLRQKVIVLDDIERKHEKLNIDEVLGFIDEFTRQHKSRFVLILNSDQLDKRDVWDTLREKVVDQELRLSTSPAEAFDIAIGLTPSAYAERIKGIVEICGLTNIRIVRKVIKAVNSVLGQRDGLSGAVLSRVIPSTVLLSAIHYKGIEEGPNFDFVLAQGTARDWAISYNQKDADAEESKRRSKWKLLLAELAINSSDDYELLIVEYLQSGLFDVTEVSKIIDRYVAEEDAMSAREAYGKFFEHLTWDHRLTEDQLLAQGTEVAGKAKLLDLYTVSALHEALSELPGGLPAADSAVALWIEGFRAKNLKEVSLGNFFRHKIHPLIEAEFECINSKAQASATALDACIHVVQKGSWGAREEAALRSATVGDMEATILNSSMEETKTFMIKMLDLCINKQNFEKHFGQASENFTQACRNIVQGQANPRLAKLIKMLFADSKLGDQLDPAPPQVIDVPVADSTD